MVQEGKPVRVVAVGGPGAGAGPLASLGVGAALVLFIVNAFTLWQILSTILGIVQAVTGAGGIGGSATLDVVTVALNRISGAASNLSFMLYLDVVAFAFLGVALIFIRIKLKQSGAGPIVAAIGAFAFAGVALYLRFILLPPILSSFDQMAVAGGSLMTMIKLAEIAIGLMSFTLIFLIEGIVFFVFGVFMRSTVNSINKSYGKMARGGRLILAVSIINLIAMGALYYGTSVLQTTLASIIGGIGGGGGGTPTIDPTTLLQPIIALLIGVFFKLIIVPILATFAFLSLTFGFYGIARGPKA